MYGSKRVAVRDFNPHILCALCGGYLIQATTVIECLHSFCRACIVKFLETSKVCPICDAQIHKTRPLLNIRPDQTLQSLVYKLVPGLFQDEMRRRREFHATLPKSDLEDLTLEERGEASLEREYKPGDDHVSLALQMVARTKDSEGLQIHDTRYLLCPSELTVRHLKKFIRCKFQLGEQHKINLFRAKEELTDELMLQDIALIYSWRRDVPMNIVYTVREFDVSTPDRPTEMKRQTATDLSGHLDEEGMCTFPNLVSVSGTRTLKSSVHEISAEGASVTSQNTSLEVFTPPVPSPPLTSSVSPTLSSPPLFSPPFFSTPTTPTVPFSTIKLPSDTSKEGQTSPETSASCSTSWSFVTESSRTIDVPLDSSKSSLLFSKDTQVSSLSTTAPVASTAIDGKESSFIVQSAFGKCSPSPRSELDPSVHTVCSPAISPPLVSVVKSQASGSTSRGSSVQSQVSSNQSNLQSQLVSHCSTTSSQCENTVSNKCPSHVSLPVLDCVSKQNLSMSHHHPASSSCMTYSRHISPPSQSSSISSSKASVSQVSTDPSRLMHSVHAILNKSSSSQRHQQTPAKLSMPLCWTPVAEPKTPQTLSTSTQHQTCQSVGTHSDGPRTQSSVVITFSEVKQDIYHSDSKIMPRVNNHSDYKASKKVMNTHDTITCSGQSGENKNLKDACVKSDVKPNQIQPSKNNVTNMQTDFGVKLISTSKNGERCTPKQETKNIFYALKCKESRNHSDNDVKPAATALPKREIKKDENDMKNFDTKKSLHSKAKDSFTYSSDAVPVNAKLQCLSPQENPKTANTLIKSEAVQICINNITSTGRSHGINNKKNSGIELLPDKNSAVSENPLGTFKPSPKMSVTEVETDKSNAVNISADNCDIKLQKLHSHPGQNYLSNPVKDQTSATKGRSMDDDAISSYIPKVQRHKAMYLAKRSVSCIEESTTGQSKTAPTTQQLMEKRNWKKRKLSTLDFDPPTSGFVPKQDKLKHDESSPVSCITSQVKSGGGIGSTEYNNLKNFKYSPIAKGHGDYCKAKVDGRFIETSNGRMSGINGGPLQPPVALLKPAANINSCLQTVSCLPMIGPMRSGSKPLSSTSDISVSGLCMSSSSYNDTQLSSGSVVSDQRHKAIRLNYAGDRASTRTCTNSDVFFNCINSSNNSYHISSKHNNNNNNNSSTSNNNNSINNSDKMMNSNTNANKVVFSKTQGIAASSDRPKPGNRSFCTDTPGGSFPQDHVKYTQIAQGPPSINYATPGLRRPSSSVLQDRDEIHKDHTSCISVEVPSSCSPSDGASTSSSATSPATDVTSPGTEDRADNSVLLELQVTPTCGKSYLPAHCSNGKGLPLDLSSGKKK